MFFFLFFFLVFLSISCRASWHALHPSTLLTFQTIEDLALILFYTAIVFRVIDVWSGGLCLFSWRSFPFFFASSRRWLVRHPSPAPPTLLCIDQRRTTLCKFRKCVQHLHFCSFLLPPPPPQRGLIASKSVRVREKDGTTRVFSHTPSRTSHPVPSPPLRSRCCRLENHSYFPPPLPSPFCRL